VLRAFGPPDELVVSHVPDPAPAAGQALVRVVAASITYIETQIRAGRGPSPAHRPQLPAVLGNGVAGVVTEIGDGVDPGLRGASVVSTTGGSGGYAELAVVNAADAIRVPGGVDVLDALALLADGRTAIALTRVAEPAPGEWVLVEAAGGGVGSLLVQLARNAGARVIAAAGSAAKLALAEQLGAGVVVDYTADDWPDRVRAATRGAGVDLVYDGVGGAIGETALTLVRDGGRFCVHGMASGSFTSVPEEVAERRRLKRLGFDSPLFRSTPEQMRKFSEEALAEAAVGRLRPTIGQTFPLEDAAKAHAAIEARVTLGKTLLLVDNRAALAQDGAAEDSAEGDAAAEDGAAHDGAAHDGAGQVDIPEELAA
jgi:NADPH2:quinone reductase